MILKHLLAQPKNTLNYSKSTKVYTDIVSILIFQTYWQKVSVGAYFRIVSEKIYSFHILKFTTSIKDFDYYAG